MLTAAEALRKLAGEELRGAQAEHLEDEAAAKVYTCACASSFLLTYFEAPHLADFWWVNLLWLVLSECSSC